MCPEVVLQNLSGQKVLEYHTLGSLIFRNEDGHKLACDNPQDITVLKHMVDMFMNEIGGKLTILPTYKEDDNEFINIFGDRFSKRVWKKPDTLKVIEATQSGRQIRKYSR